MKISSKEALGKLADSDHLFLELFRHGTMTVEVYRPVGTDFQQPHDRDEIYMVISGEGTFYSNGRRFSIEAGDFLFVPASIEHRFEDFSEDFATWVIFYGPVGGESQMESLDVV